MLFKAWVLCGPDSGNEKNLQACAEKAKQFASLQIRSRKKENNVYEYVLYKKPLKVSEP